MIKKRGTMSSYPRKKNASEGEDSFGTYTMARLSKKLSTTRRSYWRSSIEIYMDKVYGWQTFRGHNR